MPVPLAAGSNTIKLSKPAPGGGYVQLDYLRLGAAPQPVYGAISDVAVPNRGFEANPPTQSPASWGTWGG
ncbi:hypothetical protein, partial [Mycobacterium tuberculosis]|uniref:hypothetical protein n=1 Tax=Mycobacterium tuberculosis TaxID=1773 RepID=UPI00254CAFD1